MWVNQTRTDKVTSDPFTTIGDGGYTEFAFVARPVFGEHSALLTLHRAGRSTVLINSDI